MKTTNDLLQKDELLVAAGKDNPANGQPAHEAAEADMATDPNMNLNPERGDDLDEGELARLDNGQK